ncbi:hypothetical protein WNY78_16245 [Psychroserpens sp. AS72]|uniref:hypothetical protein n=1 Tax=Psychroserpens sp. AS72 TaxID=3135775 RepID=UPI0031715D3F
MLKCKLSLILFFVLLSCQTETKTETENRIVYELDDKYSKYIIEYFDNRFAADGRSGNNYDLKKQYTEIRFYGSEGEYYIITFDENDDFSDDYVSRTNRYLKLSKEYYIPIIFSEDKLLSNKERKLSRKVGGGKAFRINLDGSIEMITRM